MPVYALGNMTPDLPEKGSYWVAPDAHVIGDVILGENVGIWFGAVLRGDIEPITLGKNTNIQECAVVHTERGNATVIGDNCTIGHSAIIHGCRIGNNCLIGMGATVLNGAKIGENSLVGANALVTENKEFPPNSLIVGSPARAIRTLNEDEIESIRQSAQRYVKNWQRYTGELNRID